MSYKVLNISDGQLVCDLANGETLRLNMKEDKTVADSDITDYLLHLESIGRVKMIKIEEQVEESAPKKTPKKSQKDKED